MPLLRVSQSHSCFKDTAEGSYLFVTEHRPLWTEFWKEMDGDIDKVLDFAKKAEITDPEQWTNELHRFLFDFFSGNPKLLKNAAKKSFGDWLAQVAENHVNDPKDKYWYYKKGVKPREFIRVLQYAAEFENPKQAVAYINARTPDFGAKLYSEFLLSKTSQSKNIQSIASGMAQKAYELEKQAGIKSFEVGEKLSHLLFPNDEFEIVGIEKEAGEEDPCLIVEDQNGQTGFVIDVWNVERK